MSRRSLRPQLNQIRGWVRQGRTDAWIAHQLDVTVQQIQAFKREQDLEAATGAIPWPPTRSISAPRTTPRSRPSSRRRPSAARRRKPAARRKRRARPRRPPPRPPRPRRRREEEKPAKKPRRTRGGRTRRRTASGPLEGTFDHGEEGYGLWLDPAVQDDPVYAEHWAGHRPVEITIEEDQIVIRRAGGGEDDDDED